MRACALSGSRLREAGMDVLRILLLILPGYVPRIVHAVLAVLRK